MTLFKWSQTAASDATADSTINWSEGQAPSSVNDSARAMMAATAKYRDDIAGAIVTAGTSTAYTVASYQSFDTLAHLSGMAIAFTPHATCGSTVTLNVDSLGAKPLRSAPTIEIPGGTLVQGTPYVAVYNNTDGAFYLQGFYGNLYNVPLGSGMDYWGFTAPNSAFAFPAGQAISRTTYNPLFAILGTTYGNGDGTTTFNLPDKTGRVSAMAEASPSRLTSTYFGGTSSNIGAVGGGESKTLITGNLPAYTPAGSVGLSANGGSAPIAVAQSPSGSGVTSGASFNTFATSQFFNLTGSFGGTAQGGTSTPFRTVQPTIICNYIIRIL